MIPYFYLIHQDVEPIITLDLFAQGKTQTKLSGCLLHMLIAQCYHVIQLVVISHPYWSLHFN